MSQRRIIGTLILLTLTLAAAGAAAKSGKIKRSRDLRIAAVDVEGGAAILFVTPEGKSLLIDTGWPPGIGGPRRKPDAPPPPPMPSSADRIAAAAASLGIKKIDYLLMTHYHVDHLGGLQALLAKLPVEAFIDHGPNREEPPPNATPRQLAFATATLYPAWVAAYQGHEHITAQVGQKLDIGSMHLQFVTSDGNVLHEPLPGAGQPNPLCANVLPMDRNGGEENVRSVGTLITFGKTRILDLGDLTWNKEMELLCPVNRVGKVDVYFVTGHGMNLSSSPPTGALDPLVAVMQNGPMKGGDEAVIRTVDSYPDLKGFWRVHDSVRYPDLNGDPDYIANLDQLSDQGYPVDIDITPRGRITVTNGRNHFSRTYTARGK
ncbi:ComEC/Rec2 family competence protein [Paracidobacterium acidisoli]|uniref:MBL fold metallo-hydrolase n=1 Tax=Paracidobacterium acidisoli TaxID=2303751 RepID=A0A372IJY5_9BACT|nr:MBL fold metallo-hydrolase [Paracidobacterium acidisoli]MBT9332972.1 MBL fold metallo-hydrolase [Paracidobacterium acidisoli]